MGQEAEAARPPRDLRRRTRSTRALMAHAAPGRALHALPAGAPRRRGHRRGHRQRRRRSSSTRPRTGCTRRRRCSRCSRDERRVQSAIEDRDRRVLGPRGRPLVSPRPSGSAAAQWRRRADCSSASRSAWAAGSTSSATGASWPACSAAPARAIASSSVAVSSRDGAVASAACTRPITVSTGVRGAGAGHRRHPAVGSRACPPRSAPASARAAPRRRIRSTSRRWSADRAS